MKILTNISNLVKKEDIKLVHFNTSMSPISIVRDFVIITLLALYRTKIILHLHGGKYLFN